jgi:hypothetical protein
VTARELVSEVVSFGVEHLGSARAAVAASRGQGGGADEGSEDSED